MSTPKKTLEEKKAELIQSIAKSDAMKSDKKFVTSCIKAGDYSQLAWFFWDAFMFRVNKHHIASTANLWDLLPPNMKKYIEGAT